MVSPTCPPTGGLCQSLPEDAHTVLRAFCTKLSPQGISRLSINDVAQAIRYKREHVRDAVDDLIEARFLEGPAAGRYMVRQPCDCQKLETTISDRNSSAIDNLTAMVRLSPCRDDASHRLMQAGSQATRPPGFVAAPPNPRSDSRTGASPSARKRRANRDPAQWNAYDLASHFRDRLYSTPEIKPFGQFNQAALMGAFARWRREDGLSPTHMKHMVDALFDLYSDWLKAPGKKAFQVFIARRIALDEAAIRLEHAAETKANRDPEYWEDVYESQMRKFGLRPSANA